MASEPLQATSAWESSFPGAIAAILFVRSAANPVSSKALDAEKRRLESELRERHAGQSRAEIRASGHLPVYDAYYRRFSQTYHVLMQIESVVSKGRAIPSRAALVEAMFMAELATGILTAVHDLNALALPITVDVATGAERYLRYDGVEESCKPGDMYMRDATGSVLTSVMQGPTSYARVTEATSEALIAVYAPAGIGADAVRDHLELIRENVRLFAPEATASAVLRAAPG